MMQKFIGIDVGKAGAVAVIEANCISVLATPMDGKEYSINNMYELLISMKEHSFAVIERAQAMPGQGVVSMFEFGKGYGIWLALLAAADIPYQVVHSRVWTKVMLAGSPGIKKERNVAAARALFPSWNPRLKKDLQHCDALLLAEYARRLKRG